MIGFRKSHAVVVGIDAYGHGIPPLRTAVHDAERVAEALASDQGFEILHPAGDATLAELRELFTRKLLARVRPDDRVLVYFAGHGIALDGDDGPAGYLIPQDARRDDRASLLPMTDLAAWLDRLPCRHLLLVLDCCFAGAFRWSSTRDLGALPEVIHKERFDRYVRDPAWQVITSAAHDQKALDVLSGETIGVRDAGDSRRDHSPFAAAFLLALQGEADLVPRATNGRPGGDGIITATELYLYIREFVVAGADGVGHRQTPGFWPLKKHDKGEFIHLVPGHELNLPPAPPLDEANNPWRGLQSYDEQHAPLFFGRSKFVAALAERVRAQSLTIVLGASGTGKSSVVKAGLLPLFRSLEADAWQILPPLRPGRSPMAALAALALPGEPTDPDAIVNRLDAAGSDPEALARRMSAWAVATSSGSSSPTRLLLVVDQFEELLTLCWDDTERERFLEQLDRALAACPDRLRVVLTLRSDFEPQFAHSPLQEEWLAARIVVPAMTLDEYREAIEGPASVMVLYFQGMRRSQEFINRLIGDVANTPGALPLLSFTLSELYRRYLAREGGDRSLAEEDYEALGGVGGSLRNRADEVFTGLPDDAHRETMRRVMLRMVSVEAGEFARRRVPDADLVYDGDAENDRVREVLRRLTAARLVVEGKDVDDQPFVEPAHDELIRGWDQLRRWVREGQEGLQLRQVLSPASGDWKQHRGGLWHANPRLNLVKKVLAADDNWLNRNEARFVHASVARRRQIWTGAVGSVAAAFLLLSVITGFALIQRQEANNRRIESIQETARLLKTQGEQAQDNGHLQSAMHYYAAALERRAEIDETDPVSRLRLGVLSANAPVLRAIMDCPQRPDRVTLGPNARRLLTYSGVEGDSMAPSAWVRLWDARMGRLVASLEDGEQKRVQAARFSSDGRWLLVLFKFDNRAALWDAERGQILRRFEGHTDVVNDAIFSPDERTIVTSSRDGTARIWDVATGRELRRLNAPRGYVYVTRFSPDGRSIAAACTDEVRIWDAASGTLRHALDAGRGAMSLEFNHDGTRLVSKPFTFFINRAPDEDDYQATLWDVESGRVVHTFSEVTAVVFASPEGRIFTPLASRAWGRNVPVEGQLWRTDAGAIEPIARYEGSVSIAPQQDYFLLIDDETLRIVGTRDGRVQRTIPNVSMAAVHPEGRLLLTDFSDNTARIWDTRSGAMVTALEGHSAPVLDVDFDASGGWIATASADDSVRVWQFQPTAERELVGHEGQVTLARSFADGRRALTGSWKTGWTIYNPRVDGTVRIWDLTTGRTVAEFEDLGEKVLGGATLSAVALDATNRVALLEDGAGVRIVDVEGGRVITSLKRQRLVGYSPRDRLAFTSDGEDVAAWDESTGRQRYQVDGILPVDDPQPIEGGRIATIIDDPDDPDHYCCLAIWDIASGKTLGRVAKLWKKDRALTGGVRPPVSWDIEGVVFHPGGRSLAVLSSDADTSKIVDLVAARVTGTLKVPPFRTEDGMYRGGALNSSRMNADGRFLITVGNLTTVWDGASGRRLKELAGDYLDDSAATGRMLTLSDGQVHVWDTGDWSRVRIIRSAYDRITAARLYRDGRGLVTGSDAGAVELWDLETGLHLIRLGSLDAPISVVTPDERDLRILAGTDTGELRVWTLLHERLPTAELASWIAATTGSALPEGSEQVRGLATGVWAGRREEVIRRLGALLESSNPPDRVPVASAILRLVPSHPAAITVLVTAIDSADGSLSALAQAALALADPTSEGFRHAVASRITGGRANDAIVAIIGRLGPEGLPLIEPLLFEGKGLDRQVRANLVASLRPAGAAAVGLLARAVVDPEPLVRITAGNVLADLGPDAGPAIPAMTRAIGMDDRDARIAVARSLGELGPIAIPELIRAVEESPQHFTRLNAIVLLRQMDRQATAAIPALVRVAVEGSDEDLRSRAVDALVSIDSTEGSGALFGGGDKYTGAASLPLLRTYLEAQDARTRVRCSEVLVMLAEHHGLGEGAGADLLASALKDPSEPVRDHAALSAVIGGGDAKPDPAALPSFVKLLKHSDPKVQEQAIMAIWEVGPPLAPWTRDLLEALLQNSTDIFAGHTLRNIGLAALPYLRTCLADPSPRIRAAAADRIGNLGEDAAAAAPDLFPLLDDQDEEVRFRAAEAAIELGSPPPQVSAVLAGIVRGSGDAGRRRWAADRLPEVADLARDQVAEALIAALGDTDPDVRFEAADSLLVMEVAPDRAIQTLLDLLPYDPDHEMTSADAAGRLAKLGARAREAAPAIRRALAGVPEDANPNVEMSLVRALIEGGALDELIDVLDRGSPGFTERSEAAASIAKLLATHPDRISAVARLLSNQDAEIRSLAATILDSLGPMAQPALPALENAMADSSDSVRSAAITAVKAIRAEEWLDADAEATRLEAAEALLARGRAPDRVIDVLAAILDETSDPELRTRAVEALGKIGDPRKRPAAEALARHLDDPRPRVRYEAADGLLDLGAETERASATLKALLACDAEDGRYSALAAGRLAELDDRAPETISLIRKAASTFPEHRETYVNALGDLQAIIALVQILEETKDEDEVASLLLEIELALNDDPEAIAKLAPLLEHEDTAWQAQGIKILGSLIADTTQKLAVLQRFLNDEYEVIRKAAQEAIQEIQQEEE